MNHLSRCHPLLGTLVSIDLQADCSDDVLLACSEAAYSRIRAVHDYMGVHDPMSELNHINQYAHLGPVVVSDLTWPVLVFAWQLSCESAGLFDVSVAPWLSRDGLIPVMPSIEGERIVSYKHMHLQDQRIQFSKPMGLDLGGVAKGYAVDLAMECVIEHLGDNLQQACVNAGGDLRYYDWSTTSVGINTGRNGMLEHRMLDAAVATSSNQFSADLYHPHTGQCIEYKEAVSVFASSCMRADAFTKLAILLPDDHTMFQHWHTQIVRS